MRSDYRLDSVSLVSTDCVRGKSVKEWSVVRARCSYTLRSTVMVLRSCPATQSRLWVRQRTLPFVRIVSGTVAGVSLYNYYPQHCIYSAFRCSGTFFLDVRSSHLVLLTYFRLVVRFLSLLLASTVSQYILFSVFYDFSDSTVFFVLMLTCLPSLTIFNLPLTNRLLSLLMTNLPVMCCCLPFLLLPVFVMLVNRGFMFS